ncbi:uncharacterized protein PHACADRAFT_250630 [Phanerochaete carnosa HHB-10118-sp]|uniref:Uncharacterized protein n=1 Tax=Phanerochaete carnosa (strain HHB-10118-sp) TaxID=650164 RepID=K5WKE9_PHACS|nr:uncharacterized protein PHACADRAFT_250630 [Phanerochaete carnosa HHB-10118-sp]EKM59860.1 hypothetical protein PHACADRAFT_250630 [Phanerochaete carnosa HHB-10118-sp]
MTPTHPLDIRSCTKLRKLHLRLSISGNSVRDIASWRWHARSINDFINQSNISASTYRDLRELVISLWVDGTENEQRNPQTLIDELLASLVRRSTLEHITFEWYEKSNLSKVLTGEDFAGFVYASFPTLRENDMISIRAPAEDRH